MRRVSPSIPPNRSHKESLHSGSTSRDQCAGGERGGLAYDASLAGGDGTGLRLFLSRIQSRLSWFSFLFLFIFFLSFFFFNPSSLLFLVFPLSSPFEPDRDRDLSQPTSQVKRAKVSRFHFVQELGYYQRTLKSRHRHKEREVSHRRTSERETN